MRYLDIVKHYETCFEEHGDSHLGVDWPNADDALRRYEVVLEGLKLVRAENCLDFGSGLAHFHEFLQRVECKPPYYEGLDLSKKMIAHCEAKFPDIVFHSHDVLVDGWNMGNFDAVIFNGVFTEKRDVTFSEMFDYLVKILELAYSYTNKVIIFNLMSKQVDWERDDLFHVSLDIIADTICKRFNRKFVIRNDYGMFEYTIYLIK